MKFEPLTVAGAFEVLPEPHVDERGLFLRTWCRQTFANAGLDVDFSQCSTSFNTHRHTLRGMHYQAAPNEECKLVRCTRGAAYHVVLDLRPESSGFGSWAGVELNADNRHLLFVPRGVAHGFLSLADATEIFYQISADYSPVSARGVRWNDPAFDIEWPAEPQVISAQDAGYPDYEV